MFFYDFSRFLGVNELFEILQKKLLIQIAILKNIHIFFQKNFSFFQTLTKKAS